MCQGLCMEGCHWGKLAKLATLFFHKFIHKLIFFQYSITAFHTCHFIKGLHTVRFYTGIIDKERHRFGRMGTEFARRRMIRKHGDSHRLIPILHCFINRSLQHVCPDFNSKLLQLKISFVTGLITGLNMQIHKVVRLQCFQCCSHLILIIRII